MKIHDNQDGKFLKPFDTRMEQCHHEEQFWIDCVAGFRKLLERPFLVTQRNFSNIPKKWRNYQTVLIQGYFGDIDFSAEAVFAFQTMTEARKFIKEMNFRPRYYWNCRQMHVCPIIKWCHDNKIHCREMLSKPHMIGFTSLGDLIRAKLSIPDAILLQAKLNYVERINNAKYHRYINLLSRLKK